jgi:hypothetical protein
MGDKLYKRVLCYFTRVIGLCVHLPYCIQRHAATQVILLQVSLHKVGNYLPCIFNFVKHRDGLGGLFQVTCNFCTSSLLEMCTWRTHKVTTTQIKATGTHFKSVSVHECK